MNEPRQRKTRIVDHTIYGTYVWQLPDGRYFMNENQDVLSIPSVRGDIQRLATLARRAREYGQPEGAPVFLAGATKISEQEYQDQMDRHLRGEIADPLDVGAYLAELREGKQRG